jgi:hypothetical protein
MTRNAGVWLLRWRSITKLSSKQLALRALPAAERPLHAVDERPPQTGQKLHAASPPLAALEVKVRDWPMKRTALAGKPMKGMKPEPEALRQSSQ